MLKYLFLGFAVLCLELIIFKVVKVWTDRRKERRG